MNTRRYKDYDERVIEMLKVVYNSIESRSKFDNSWYLSFDMLALNLQTYYKMQDKLLSDGPLKKDGGISPTFKVMNEAQRQIRSILSSFGLTPEGLSRIRSYGDKTESSEELIEKLLA